MNKGWDSARRIPFARVSVLRWVSALDTSSDKDRYTHLYSHALGDSEKPAEIKPYSNLDMRPDMERSLYVMLCDAELRKLDPERQLERSVGRLRRPVQVPHVLQKRHQITGPAAAVDRLCSMASTWQSEHSTGKCTSSVGRLVYIPVMIFLTDFPSVVFLDV